jgi:hypothetical protein
LRVDGADAALVEVARLLNSPERRAAMADAGRQLLEAHRGATQRTMQWLAGRIEAAAVDRKEAGPSGDRP